MRTSIFVDNSFYSSFPVFWEEPFNPEESAWEKIHFVTVHLVTVHLQESIFIFRIILNNWWKLTLLFQSFWKFRENVTWTMKVKSTISAKIFSGKRYKAFAEKSITLVILGSVTTDFRKAFIWKKVTSIAKSRKCSRGLVPCFLSNGGICHSASSSGSSWQMFREL